MGSGSEVSGNKGTYYMGIYLIASLPQWTLYWIRFRVKSVVDLQTVVETLLSKISDFKKIADFSGRKQVNNFVKSKIGLTIYNVAD